MNNLPIEKIAGKWYQPVEFEGAWYTVCDKCSAYNKANATCRAPEYNCVINDTYLIEVQNEESI